MCQPKSRGGQRCAFHTRNTLTEAHGAYYRNPSTQNWERVQEARAEYAATPGGRAAMEQELARVGVDTAEGIDLAAALRRGEQIGERNKAVGAALRNGDGLPAAAGDALADRYARSVKAGRPDLHPDVVDLYTHDSSAAIRLAVAKRDDLTEAQAQRLAADENFGVRQTLARHTRHPGVMASLAGDPESLVDLAHNPHATAPALDRMLAASNSISVSGIAVRQAIARHPNTASATLELLTMDPDRSVSSAAHRALTHPDERASGSGRYGIETIGQRQPQPAAACSKCGQQGYPSRPLERTTYGRVHVGGC